MEKLLVAVPSSLPGGLDAEVSPHFGHCAVYTLLEVANGCVYKVATLPNVPHGAGKCMEPVAHLAQKGVNTLIASGIGLRPLTGCSELNIEVFCSEGPRSVASVINDFLTGRLERFAPPAACSSCTQ